MLYHLTRHRLMIEGQWKASAMLYRTLDSYIGSIHPSKFDEVFEFDHNDN